MKIIANDYESKDVIKILREWTNLKQPEFGKSIGFSGMTIQSYERGTRKYTFDTLIRIAKNMDIKLQSKKMNDAHTLRMEKDLILIFFSIVDS